GKRQIQRFCRRGRSRREAPQLVLASMPIAGLLLIVESRVGELEGGPISRGGVEQHRAAGAHRNTERAVCRADLDLQVEVAIIDRIVLTQIDRGGKVAELRLQQRAGVLRIIGWGRRRRLAAAPGPVHGKTQKTGKEIAFTARALHVDLLVGKFLSSYVDNG